MKHYTLAEKAFIAENHPTVILESYQFGSEYNDIEHGPAVCDSQAFRDSGLKALADWTPSEVFYLRLQFRDLNTKHPYYRIRFTGEAQFISERDNIVFDISPDFIFDEPADPDGRFSVLIPFMCRDLTDEMIDEESFHWLSDDTGEVSAVMDIRGFHIANQFAETCFDLSLCISETDGKPENNKPAYTMKPIVYDLTPDWIVDQVMVICEDKKNKDSTDETPDADAEAAIFTMMKGVR